MGYSQENGYVPTDIDTIMASLMANINTQFELDPAYTMETFEGTAFYKYFYALAQRMQESEVKTSEIFIKLQQYIDVINERISRPVVTNPGLIEKLEDVGYVASVKPMIDADAGKIHICIDADDGVHALGEVEITSFANLVSGTDDVVTIGATAFTAQAGAATPGTGTFQAATSNAATATSLAAQINAHATAGALVKARAVGAIVKLRAIHGGTAGNIALSYTDNDTNVGATVSGATLTGGTNSATYAATKLTLCTLISNSTAAGGVTQGTESEAIVLSNGQSFDFKYNLPDKIGVLLRLTITLSENNQVVVGDPDEVKLLLLENINDKYRLGRNFEPQRYFSVVDAPWASQVLLEYSFDDGDTWETDIYEAEYNELFDIQLEDIELVEE
jgi:hypothetical protein